MRVQDSSAREAIADSGRSDGPGRRDAARSRTARGRKAALSRAGASFRGLVEFTERLSGSIDRSEIHRTVVRAAARLTGADVILLRMVNGERLDVVASSGIDDATVAGLPPVTTRTEWVVDIVANGRAWVCDDVALLPDADGTAWFGSWLPIRGEMFLPLVNGGRLIGTLAAMTRDPRRWSAKDAEVLTALGAHAAMALRNVELIERAEARAAQLAVIQAAGARMNRATTIEAVGRAIVEEVGAIVDYHNARVYLVEPPDDLVPIAFEGRVGAYEIVDWNVLRTKVGEGFTGWVAANGVPLCIPDANADPRGAQIPGTDEVPESMLVVPLRHEDGVIGVITLSKLELNQFDDDDLQVLTILADQAATALESARLLTRTETLASELRRLLDLSQELSQSLDPREVGSVIARHLALALGVERSTISSWDRKSDAVVTLGEYPEGGPARANPTYSLARFPETRRVLETQATLVIDADDPTADAAEVSVLRNDDQRMLAMLPLVAKGESVGLLELTSAEFVDFDAGRLALARTMANEAAMAVENARLYDSARSLADRDPLTGFYNHRFLYERLGEEVVRARRGRQPLSLLMLDVDDFKLVNDTFGHQFGDRCLVVLAEVIRSTLRGSDIPARYGGDEFAVILPETDADAAIAAAHRIVEELSRNPVVADGRGPVPVDVSIGVASLGATTRTPTDLVAVADAQMYAAKMSAHANELDRVAEAITPA